MERLEPEVPQPKALSEESLAVQEAESEAGAFVFFRRYFRDGEELQRDGDGELETELEVTSLVDEGYTVGRHPQCDLVLAWDPTASRSHARITKAGGNWYVEDLGSENGTALNGARVGRERLTDGDQLRVGDTILVFRQIDPSESRDTVKAGAAYPTLTDAQRQVLVALAGPLFGADSLLDPATNSEIAEQVHLSVDSVKGHLRHLYKVFEIGPDVPQNRKRRKLADEAIRRGAVTSRDYPS